MYAKGIVNSILARPVSDRARMLYKLVQDQDMILKLKDSTKQLLRLVEEIQSKTRSSRPIPDDTVTLSKILDSQPSGLRLSDIEENNNSCNSELSAVALQRLDFHTKNLERIEIQNEDDNCSVYKKLTRKCVCMNRSEFNDFVIHFNEDIRSCTSTLGEIIKNLRILKKFLYMGGGYTKNSLLFLNEGLQKGMHNEKVDIIQACTHADICNVFDDDSLVTVCIWWTIKLDGFGDDFTQSAAVEFLYRLAQLEEGRRYLNFSTKISNDIKKVLKKKSAKLSDGTVEKLAATQALLNPPISQQMNVTYYCKAEEGMGFRTIHSLTMYRSYMTMEEVFTHLDWLNSFSEHDKGRTELTQYLPNMLSVFKKILLEYDNSEINICITSILNNLVSKTMTGKSLPTNHGFVVANISTEPIAMKPALIQVPSVMKNVKHRNKNASRRNLTTVTNSRKRT